MKHIFFLFILLSFFSSASAQNRKVLLEEFTGAHCGQCPMGSYMLDSMLNLYPDLIGVSLHSYGIYDAMFFPDCDTLGLMYAQGAPLGAVDRICPTPPANNTGQYINTWDGNIQQRLTVPASLTVSVTPTWTSSTRNISALITVNMLANLPAGDYRITMYVVEDSVTGTGSGYDQESFYDQQPGPFYGMGNPIVGFMHRHVARAILPSPWGQTGIIPSTPMNGQTFTTTLNYTLPASYNENRVHLVAFVNRVSSDHANDEVLNAEEVDLIGPTAVNEITERPFAIYVNPPDLFFIDAQLADAHYEVLDALGRTISNGAVEMGITTIDLRGKAEGVYFLKVFTKEEEYCEKIIIASSVMR